MPKQTASVSQLCFFLESAGQLSASFSASRFCSSLKPFRISAHLFAHIARLRMIDVGAVKERPTCSSNSASPSINTPNITPIKSSKASKSLHNVILIFSLDCGNSPAFSMAYMADIATSIRSSKARAQSPSTAPLTSPSCFLPGKHPEAMRAHLVAIACTSASSCINRGATAAIAPDATSASFPFKELPKQASTSSVRRNDSRSPEEHSSTQPATVPFSWRVANDSARSARL
mmetsp:Transcript_7486/g.19324  ORF Transcript_7486/g.19324 Transcript_7486/m.19324 type:complete len:232 (-) Transcript_7486:695-1390(-)